MSNTSIRRSTRFQDELQNMVTEDGRPRPAAYRYRPPLPGESTEPHVGGRMENLIVSICRARGVECDMVLPAALVALSAAAGSNFRLRAAGYVNPCNLWACVVAPSGSNKSQPAADVFEPLTEINRLLYDIYREEVESALAGKGGNKKKVDEATLMRTIKRPQLIISDTTPEARNQALGDNPHGLLLYADELSTFLGGIDRYSSGNDAAQLMSIHDGKDLQINRKTDFMQCVRNPFLSVFGTIQPKLYIELLMNERLVNSGFSQRILVFCPEPTQDNEYADLVAPDPEAVRQWKMLLEDLYDAGGDREYTLSPMAEALYATFYDHMSKMIADDETSEAVASCIGKIRIALLKIALLTALSFHRERPADDRRVHAGDMLMAMETALRALDNFEAFHKASLPEIPVLSKKELARQLTLCKPDITCEHFMSLFGASQATAYRWLREFGAKSAGA